MNRRSILALAAVLSAALVACSQEPEPNVPAPRKSPPSSGQAASKPPQEPAAPLGPEELVARGRAVYMSNCIACHNVDPGSDGALGPAVTGSSRELLQARVLLGTYPDGYRPKRETRVMVALPHLEPDIGALAAFLAE